jgi:hypothetical protein
MIETLSNAALVSASLPVALVDADDTANGAGVAWSGNFRSVMAVMFTGAWTDGTFTFELQDSPDNVTYTAVADAYLDNAEPALAAADAIAVVGYKGTKKYLRVSVTSTATTDGAVVGAFIVASNPNRAPV